MDPSELKDIESTKYCRQTEEDRTTEMSTEPEIDNMVRGIHKSLEGKEGGLKTYRYLVVFKV